MILTDMQDTLSRFKIPRQGHHAWKFCSNRDANCGCGNHLQSCLLNRTLTHFERLILMPRGKNVAKNQFVGTTFVRCELTADDKKKVPDWTKKNTDRFDDLVVEVLQSGHKISLSYTDHTDSFIASITGKPEGCDNAGKCMTSHGKTHTMALWVALFKFHVIYDRGVWEEIAEESDFG